MEKRTGHKEHSIFGFKLLSETPDILVIVQHNTGKFPFVNYKFLGKFKAARPHTYRQRDIVTITTDNKDDKKILAIAQVGRESIIRYMLHDQPFVFLCTMGGLLLALRLTNII